MDAKLIFYYSSMNSGKSLDLLTRNHMITQRGGKTLLLKPETDDRTKTISSRLGIEAECRIIPKDGPIFQDPHDISYDFILVDEAQFLTKEQVWELADFVDSHNVEVLCYGLKLNWQGEFFEGSHELMKTADELIELKTYCKENGKSALFHIKLNGSDSEVETGYEEMYDTVSRQVWKKWWKDRK